MSIALQIADILAKALIPYVILEVIGSEIIYRKYHFMYLKNRCISQRMYPREHATAIVFGLILVFTATIDILYIIGTKTHAFVNNLVNYFAIQKHSTLYTFFRYNLSEHPVMTWLYIVYLVIMLFKFGYGSVILPVWVAKNELKNL